MENFKLTKFGLLLIVIGTIGFLTAAIISFTPISGLDQGALPAASFLLIMIGIAFAFPSMLQDTSGGVSTMRIIVFAVVLLFCTIYLKIGWSITKLETLGIDQKWVYILGLAFGSKAFQRYGEKPEPEEDGSNQKKAIPKEKDTSHNQNKKDTSDDESI